MTESFQVETENLGQLRKFHMHPPVCVSKEIRSLVLRLGSITNLRPQEKHTFSHAQKGVSKRKILQHRVLNTCEL